MSGKPRMAGELQKIYFYFFSIILDGLKALRLSTSVQSTNHDLFFVSQSRSVQIIISIFCSSRHLDEHTVQITECYNHYEPPLSIWILVMLRAGR